MPCILANAFEVIAKAVSAQFVVRNSAEVGLDRRWIPYLAVVEGSGVVGLVLFFVGAVLAHVRARVFHNLGFPVVFLFLAVAAVGHFGGSLA